MEIIPLYNVNYNNNIINNIINNNKIIIFVKTN